MSRIKDLVLRRIGIAELTCAIVVFALAYLALQTVGVSLVLGGLGAVTVLLARLLRRLARIRDQAALDRADGIQARQLLEEALADLRHGTLERHAGESQQIGAILSRQAKSILALQEGALQTLQDNKRRAVEAEQQRALLLQQADAVQLLHEGVTQTLQDIKRRAAEVEQQRGFLTQQAEAVRLLQENSASALLEIERHASEVGLARLGDTERERAIKVLQDALASNRDQIERISTATDELRSAQARQNISVQALQAQLSRTDIGLRAMERDADIVRTGVIEVTRTGGLPSQFYTASSFDPEVDVLPVIAEHVKSRIAIDVGANRGDFTAALRRFGFVVHAFEPLPALHAALSRRFSSESDQVHIYQMACSDSDGSAQLHLATARDRAIDPTLFSTLGEHPSFDGLAFDDSIEVPLRRLDSVFADSLPFTIGLLKTDTEGHDVSVLKGANGIDAAVLMVEFWDREYVFNVGTTRNSLRDYLELIDQTKYPFRIVMWRGLTRDEFGIEAGSSETRPGSWGNIMFLSDISLVDAVVEWARRTYGVDRVEIAGDLK